MGGGEVVKKGYLIKSPPLEGKGMKNWHKRFFCLYSSKIFEYYKTEGGEKKGVINLEDCTAVNSGLQHKKYQHVFDIETSDRIYYLVASSEEEMTEWVDTLCRVCEFTSADDDDDDVPPPVQPRSLSLQPNHAATLETINLPNAAAVNPKFGKERSQTLSTIGSTMLAPDNLYSLAGQDSTYGQHKSGIPLTDYFEQSGIAQTKRSEGDSRTSIASVTSNGPPAGISLSEALSMKGYGTLGQCTIGPAVPPRTPLNDALQMKGIGQMPVSEGDSAASTASIVREAEMEVKRMLRQQSLSEVQVKPGTPLNEALAQKGIINSPEGGGGFGSSQSFTSGLGSVPDDDPEDHYNVPRNNQPAFFPENDITPPPRYQSLPRRISEDYYQSPRSLMDDSPDQVYNVPPPPRPAPVPRTSPSRKKRSTLLSQDSKDNGEASATKVNGTSAAPPPIIDRSKKPRPPPVNRNVKPGRSESFKNDIPQMTKDSVHYVSLSKLRIKEEGKPVPRPRSGTKKSDYSDGTKKSDYSEVDLEGTLAMEKKFTIIEETPRVPERTRDSLVDVYSSNDDDDDDDSAGSDVSYTKMKRFTLEEADKPDTYYQTPRQALEEEFDDPRESLPTGL